MNEQEREVALQQMRAVTGIFYAHATRIGVHPFIEFCGLMNEYIECCTDAHRQGVDFTSCNTHTGQTLPIQEFRKAYINEKLECIFTGSKVLEVPHG